jgi:hypothetical protein
LNLTKQNLEEALGKGLSEHEYTDITTYLRGKRIPLTVKNAVELLQSLRFAVDTNAIDDNFYKWATAYFLIEGAPFNLEKTGWHFWEEIYRRGEEPKVAMRKASQIGASFYAFARALYHTCVYPDKYFRKNNLEVGSANASGNVLYVFPTDTDMRDLVVSKFDPIAEESPYIKKKMSSDGGEGSKNDVDNISTKKINSNFLYFRGSQNKRRLKSITGGLIILDEYAEIAEGVDTLVKRRMNAQALKTMLYLSNPEAPELDIDAEFLAGTMDYYFVQCEHCKKESTPNFFTHHNKHILENQDSVREINPQFEMTEKVENLLSGGSRWVCPHCFHDFKPSAKGQWKSEAPDAPHRSYHIPLILSPVCNAKEEWALWEKAKKDEFEKENFYKHNLGLPYVNTANALSYSDLIRCKKNYQSRKASEVPTTMGVDWGMYDHYYTISENLGDGRSRLVACGKVQADDEVEELVRLFKVSDFACDLYGKSGGGMETVKKFLDRIRKRGVNAVGCTHANLKSSYINQNQEVGVVNYDKSKCLDRLYNRIRAQMIEFPQDINKDFLEHHCTFVRENKSDKDGGSGFIYVSKTGKKVPDHYQSAHYFNTVAMDISDIRATQSADAFVFFLN